MRKPPSWQGAAMRIKRIAEIVGEIAELHISYALRDRTITQAADSHE
jgi:hypothetical protein